MPRLPVADLLSLQTTAYQLLLHLDHLAERDPRWLGPDSLARLSRGRPCAAWLEEHRSSLPTRLVPPPPIEHFANLLSSFFDVSFKASSVVVDDNVAQSGIRRNRAPVMRRAADAETAIALRYQLSRDGVKLSLDECRTLSKREGLRDDALIIAYVWELERRAVGKSKGEVAHRIWLNLPHETRTNLSVEMFEHAMKRVREAAQEMRAAP